MRPTLNEFVSQLYREYGPSKPMGISAEKEHLPHYFLHRQFLGVQDLLVIFNTKKCRYRCHFCALPAKSTSRSIPAEAILSQFEYVLNELKHSLSVLNRITISNEGSVLDTDTFPRATLVTIAQSTTELRAVRTLVFETRLEFASPDYIDQLAAANPKAGVDVLTGFETLDERIRDNILHKSEPLAVFIRGLDSLAQSSAALTTYVLFKPDPYMTDAEAKIEADASISFLQRMCEKRGIPLTVRLNPMYAASDTQWAKLAFAYADYSPPRLSDVLDLAKRKRAEGLRIYIGLSTEGLEQQRGTYRAREDYSHELLKQAILFNQGQ